MLHPLVRSFLVFVFGATAWADDDFTYFESNVRPILVERCHACHGPEKQKADLRLDRRESVMVDAIDRQIIVPGRPDESLLIEAIRYDNPALQMPPKSKLRADEIEVLTEWIRRGAAWPEDRRARGSTDATFDFDARAKHWSFQPLRDSVGPEIKSGGDVRSAIDRYIRKKLDEMDLTVAPAADRPSMIRRLTYDLIGLPPTPAEISAFASDSRVDAYERLVDRLLASPRYGERWGRLWLDLVRYAEGSGHEFDIDIPSAWRYRDYVVRAFNADVPYDQFVREHISGDLIEAPRRDAATGRNESILGTGFYFLGEGVHSPLDLREDQARRADNQIDVVSKTFFALTVSCARCHDHKFDPIRTEDYYALAGYMKSTRFALAPLDGPERIADQARELSAIRKQIGDRLGAGGSVDRGRAAVGDAELFEDFDRADYTGWFVSGVAFGSGPSVAGEPALSVRDGRAEVSRVAAGLAHSGRDSERFEGVLRSRTFTIERGFAHLLASGRNGRIKVTIEGFEKIREPLYGHLHVDINMPERLAWTTIDLTRFRGMRAYFELADGGAPDYRENRPATEFASGWLAVDAIWFSDEPSAPHPAPGEPIGRAISDQEMASISDMLTRCVAIGGAIHRPTYGLAAADGTGIDDRVHIRGSIRNLGDRVPRRMIEVLGGLAPPSASRAAVGSGRGELAEAMVDGGRSLLARVIVNRLWHHHFGRGLAATVDDFGHMGEPPSHPELLDWLARELIAGGWSLKTIHRRIILSATYGMSTRSDDKRVSEVDPRGVLLARYPVRRLDAEQIHDAILAVSGGLVERMGGPSVPLHLSPFMEGRGRPESSGPLDGDGRRAIYIAMKRNFSNPLLQAFDVPPASSTMGRRNATNVPAQALALWNDAFVLQQADGWGRRVALGVSGRPVGDRVRRMFIEAYGVACDEIELEAALAFLNGRDDESAWAGLAHALLNAKRFRYLD